MLKNRDFPNPIMYSVCFLSAGSCRTYNPSTPDIKTFIVRRHAHTYP